MEFVNREKEIMRVLKRLIKERLDLIVVGGYAVSGLARHRFSVDCDVVVPKKELPKLEEILCKEGFKKHVRKTGFDQTYGGEFISYKKEVSGLPVTMDLLVGSLVCKATDASWSFDYIKKHSTEATVTGMETSANCRIPEKELLIAFKIHSARRTDIRDIIMLTENADWEKIMKHIKKGRKEAVREQAQRIIKALEDPKLVDSLEGVFVLTTDVKKQIESTRKGMETIFSRRHEYF
jgi:hypothetical protein